MVMAGATAAVKTVREPRVSARNPLIAYEENRATVIIPDNLAVSLGFIVLFVHFYSGTLYDGDSHEESEKLSEEFGITLVRALRLFHWV